MIKTFNFWMGFVVGVLIDSSLWLGTTAYLAAHMPTQYLSVPYTHVIPWP
jgi:hypothetical protein